MKKLFLAAGVAAMAIASPALADKGKNENGKGRGGGGERAFKMERGGGERAFKMERGGGDRGESFKKAREQRAKFSEKRFEERKKFNERRFEQVKKSDERRFERAKKSDERRFEQAKKAREQRFEAEKRFAEQRGKAFEDRSKRFEKIAERRRDAQERVFDRRRDDRARFAAVRDFDDFDRWENVRSRAYGCPPGLAKKDNGCLPPGQAKKLIGSRLPAAYTSAMLPDQLRYLYQDDDDHYYRYGDGYLYRVDRGSNLVASLLPMFGGSYGLGQAFPLANPAYSVPNYYSAFYPDTPYSAYRYDDGYMYQVDPRTGLVENIMPSLGYGYGVGQMLPAGYSAYNVPYQYRDMYYDTDDAYYRYAPGAIYQVDPQTNLITSVASLLTGSPLGVGQALPTGYDVYNVPYDYRDRYADSSDAWYRYADGNIYQVDPTTRLITAVIDAIV